MTSKRTWLPVPTHDLLTLPGPEALMVMSQMQEDLDQDHILRFWTPAVPDSETYTQMVIQYFMK